MVTIYTMPNCQPCRLSKMTMDRNGVPYVERNIVDDPEAYEEVKSLGYSAAPVIVTPAGEHWTGLRPDLLNALTP